MRKKTFEGMNCSVARTLDVIGEWWSMLIIRDAFRGVTRFDDFQERLGISRNILTNRLGHLVEKGVLERHAYQDHPPRYDYRLTDKGRDLWMVLATLRQWGDTWESPNGIPVVVEHKGHDHDVTVVAVCDACGERINSSDVASRLGPGAVPGQEKTIFFVGAEG